ncbi:hypothetical protein CVIRNUC_003792 [Coccomyxa viridis]|uniref:Uncharacterized protein n=1 Tax=Coccomyxa viridis TaxID=1274662 RepID=A0AAV1I0T8_9CHLO|nr:hypothetical protein CVIRNUC_003792 [Coccomyxa viridis]
MGKNKKQKRKEYAMDIDGNASAASKGSGADFVPMEDTPAPTRGKRDPLGVKVKPKRGKSSRKQKQRIALKLDKAMAASDRSVARVQKRTQKGGQRQSLKHLWNNKEGIVASQQEP